MSAPAIRRTNAKPQVSGKTGRPTKRDPKTVTMLVAAFNNLMTDTEACWYAGISRETYYQWLKQDPIFSDQMQRAKAHPKMKAKETLLYAISEKKSWMAASWLLERLEPEQYASRQKIDLEAKVVSVNLSPEQWEGLIGATNAADSVDASETTRALPEGGGEGQAS